VAPEVIDSHPHFWDPARAEYPWMTGELASLRRPFGPQELEPVLREAGVEATVVVQARSSLQETRELLELAARVGFVAGVVGWVDLMDGNIASTLRQLQESPGGDRLVAVRHQVHDEADPGWLLRPDVQRGIGAVAEAGLAHDLLVRTRELPAALAAVGRFPRARFVIDHLAKPPIASGSSAEWTEAMARFSDRENVYCKLSGMVTEADWKTWSSEDLRPYIERVLGWFGADRCMFGSDWPVCLVAASYRQVLDSLRSILAPLPQRDRDKIFGAAARSFYRLRAP
jgi:L-fuconolactonase